MTGTNSQIEWADEIKPRVHAEFDRVASALRGVSQKQNGQQRADTLAIIAIVDEKRAEVLGRNDAGYFIRDWQELNDQVRRMIAQDSRYQLIVASGIARKSKDIYGQTTGETA